MSGIGTDYFGNLQRVRRFPWTLYHRPLERSLGRFLAQVATERPDAHVLVVGCGLFQEADRAPSGLTFTAVDIDPRAVEAARRLADPRLVNAHLVSPHEDLSRLGPFDAVYGKEVIEHIVEYAAYLTRLRAAIRPGGRLWLSTPNYGEPWLPLLESTALEAVARRSGYTRRGLHPSPFTRRSFAQALAGAGFEDVRVQVTSYRLAVVGTARCPR